MRTPPKFQVAIFDFNKAHKAIRTLVLYPRLDGYFDIWESYNGQGGIIVPLIQTNWEIEKDPEAELLKSIVEVEVEKVRDKQ